MQSFWDLLPASLWPTQPFIPPDQQARVLQALWAQQSPGNSLSPASAGVTNLAGSSAWRAPNPAPFASGDDDASTAGGILGAVLGSSAGTPSATSFPNRASPQAAPFVPAVLPADALNPQAPPGGAPAVPLASTASNAPPPERSMLPRPPSPEDPYGREPPQGWLMRQLERFDPPLASSIRNGSAWEPITAPAQSIGPNIHQAAKDSAQLFRNGAYETIHGNTFAGPARMALGTLGVLYSPFIGAARTLGEEATKWTGNPDFGGKVEFLAPLFFPTSAARLGSVGSRISDATNSLTPVRRARLADSAAPAAAARAPSPAPTMVADQSSGARVSTPNVTSSVAVKSPGLGEADHVASPPLGWSDIDELRAKWGVPTRHTVAVAHTDVPGLEDVNLEGGSPLVRDEAGLPRATPGPVRSPADLPRDRDHAEEDIANQFIRIVERRGWSQSDLDGRTLTIRLSKSACPTCRWGLDSDASPGVLKQLSDRYPGLTIVVESEVEMGPMVRGVDSFAIRGGRYVGRNR